MRILVSNDDGYLSPGLAALVRAVRPLGEVTVVAPEQNCSGASNSLTLTRPLTVHQAENGFYFVNGTPTDCVHVALTGMLSHMPDLVVSGINNGQNMGDDTVYSGTVAAAMEGFLFSVPAIAFSLADRGVAHLDSAQQIAHDVVARFCARPLSSPVLLNVNIPSLPLDQIKGIEVTRLGRRHPAEPVIKASNPRGETIWWVGEAGAAKDAGPGTDFGALNRGYVSVTPLRVDLTHHEQLNVVGAWLNLDSAAPR